MAAELVGRLFLMNDQGSVVREADYAIDWVVIFRWSQNDIKSNDTRDIEHSGDKNDFNLKRLNCSMRFSCSESLRKSLSGG